jgi:hypothetical protein
MFYLKLALMSMLFFSLHLALPWTCGAFQEVWFTVRCGVAGWTDDHQMYERLIREEQDRLALRNVPKRVPDREQEQTVDASDYLSEDDDEDEVATLQFPHPG